LARRIAAAINGAINGAINVENPLGAPRFRSVIRLRSSPAGSQVYVVSIGNGPCAVRRLPFDRLDVHGPLRRVLRIPRVTRHCFARTIDQDLSEHVDLQRE
jgi:hypothetical protein